MGDYDVIVIGAGPAGEHCAGHLADGGLKVAIVERELVAGECSYWACIPSKTLLRPGEAVAGARNAPGAREAIGGPIDVGSALAWRDFMVNDYDDSGQVRWLVKKGIDLLRGVGRIAAPGAVAVGDERHRARHIVLATGSEPVIPPIPGLRDLGGVWTNREATSLKQLPRSVLVLGGGPAGVELSQAFARLGAAVVLVEQAERVLAHEPRELGEGLARVLAADGVELHLGRGVSSASVEGGEYVVELADGEPLRGERLLVATGRRPRVHDIGLENAGIAEDTHGIPVDERMAAAEGVWAIGDATGIWPLTYVGKYQGRIVAANILGEDRRASYEAVPRAVFTDPQVAAVGASEGELVASAPLSEVAKTATYTRNYEELGGFLTLVSDGERLTGAYGLGPDASEWMQQATLAIRARVPLATLEDTIQPFPTFSEAFLYALGALAARRAAVRATPPGA